MSVQLLDEKIERWLKNEHAVALYREGIEKLQDSGIIDLLARMGIPGRHFNGDAAGLDGQWANGFQSALVQLEHFERLFRKPEQRPLEAPDFGGTEDAIKRGDLRREDLRILNGEKK